MLRQDATARRSNTRICGLPTDYAGGYSGNDIVDTYSLGIPHLQYPAGCGMCLE
jgi:hypothetical protein